ncbi:transcriptional regulator [Oxalobacteraceae bacterium OTU3CINTB1]|nr:transcriptional regulator [Oxalobacteraceae bacterium OTU3CINTB1]
MTPTRRKAGKEQLRQRRAQLYEAIARGEINLQDSVKEMRAVSRLTQAGFAAHRGVSTKVIKAIEGGTGNPTVGTLNRIGAFFGLEVAFVRTETLRTDGEPKPQGADARDARQVMEEIKKLLASYDANEG